MSAANLMACLDEDGFVFMKNTPDHEMQTTEGTTNVSVCCFLWLIVGSGLLRQSRAQGSPEREEVRHDGRPGQARPGQFTLFGGVRSPAHSMNPKSAP